MDKTKQNIEAKSSNFTEKEIEDFLKECGKKPMFTQQDFITVLGKNIEDLTYKDVRILFEKIGQLSDEERQKFKYVLVFENLTDYEKERYSKIYPSSAKFDKYFPELEKVEEHYKIHFLSLNNGNSRRC